MSEKPILFSGEMVKAILDGRKTMTRRVVRNDAHCPYASGDTLWVRETWCPLNLDYEAASRKVSVPPDGANVIVSYRADHRDPRGDAKPLQWRPSIFMPRWAARITLRITDVKVERLQDISEGDAMAEGLTSWSNEKQPDVTHYGIAIVDEVWSTDPRFVFRRLWDSINAKRGFGWDANPWVWVVSFEKL